MNQTERRALVAANDCIVFDLDGTLLDTRDAMLASLDELLASIHRPAADRVVMGEAMHFGLTAMLHAALDDGRALPSGRNLQRLECGLRMHYLRKARTRVRPYPGMTALVERLHQRGIWMGICSNQAEASARRLLRRLNLGHYFGAIVGGDTFARHKPDPMPLTWLMGRAGSRPEHTLMVGDSAVDAATAEAAGCSFAHMTHGYGGPGIDAVHRRFDNFHALAAFLDVAQPA